MLEGEIPAEKKTRGRPRIPIEEKKEPVNTTLHRQTIQEIEENDWKINELIQDGINHRKKCKTILGIITEENQELKIGNDRMQRKLAEFANKIELLEVAAGENTTHSDSLPRSI